MLGVLEETLAASTWTELMELFFFGGGGVKSPWANHPLHSLTAGPMVRPVTDTLLPIRWACPGMPAPAPTGHLHTGQSDSHPKMDTGLLCFNEKISPVGYCTYPTSNRPHPAAAEQRQDYHNVD